MHNQTVVITGANRGIGLEFCHYYKNQQANVIAVCRKSSSALDDVGVEVIDGIDVTEESCVQQLKKQVDNRSIEILINNAGILRHESLSNMDFASIDEQFKVNALAPLRVTYALLDSLTIGSKLALITSRMGSMEDNGSGGYYGYRMSKAALNAAGKSLALDLKAQQVAVGIFHPGYVRTAMTGHSGDISAKEAARRLAARIDELHMNNSGTFCHSNGEVLPW